MKQKDLSMPLRSFCLLMRKIAKIMDVIRPTLCQLSNSQFDLDLDIDFNLWMVRVSIGGS